MWRSCLIHSWSTAQPPLWLLLLSVYKPKSQPKPVPDKFHLGINRAAVYCGYQARLQKRLFTNYEHQGYKSLKRSEKVAFEKKNDCAVIEKGTHWVSFLCVFLLQPTVRMWAGSSAGAERWRSSWSGRWMSWPPNSSAQQSAKRRRRVPRTMQSNAPK